MRMSLLSQERNMYRKYDLSDKEIEGLANLALQEQGSIDGACAELSLMANLFEQQSRYNTLYEYVRNGGWFSRAAHWMDNGNAGETYRQYARYVLKNGLRTVPSAVNEHDCFSDIKSISTGAVRDRSDYVRDKTVIKNRYGSTYTFYCFPTSGSDPFGYTRKGEKVSGSLQNIIDKEWELAQIPYTETGTNHQIFSSVVNNAGLEGCQNEPWCATYQFALEVMEFGVEAALEHWHMTGSTYCGYSCFETFDTFQRAGKTGTTPRIGALVIFKHSHMGRVLSIDSDGKTFDCGEGNTSNLQYDRNGDSCAVKTYSWSDSRIKGFCYIDYVTEEKFEGIRALVAAGQKHTINFTGVKIEVDGLRGAETYRNMARCLQRAANLDWQAGLEEDGIIGPKTRAAFQGHYIKFGEEQKMVTAVEIIAYCLGRDPKGVEYPGIYGSGLAAALGTQYLSGEAILALLD